MAFMTDDEKQNVIDNISSFCSDDEVAAALEETIGDSYGFDPEEYGGYGDLMGLVYVMTDSEIAILMNNLGLYLP